MKINVKNSKGFILAGIILLLVIILAVMPRNNINKIVSMEAGGELPDAGAFFKSQTMDAQYVTDMAGINKNEPGIHDIEVRSGKKTYRVKLEIIDTVAPDAEIEMVDIYESRPVEPREFIKSVKDATEVTVSYKDEPDYSKTGSQQVVLILEDT